MEALIKQQQIPTSYGDTGSSITFKSLSDIWSIEGISTIFFEETTFPQEVAQLLQKLDRIEHLEHNWNGYNAAAPSAQAIQNARDFIISNRRLALPFYFISPGVNGEIMLEFNQENRAAELYFNSDGTTELILFENDDTFLESNLSENFQTLIEFFNE